MNDLLAQIADAAAQDAAPSEAAPAQTTTNQPVTPSGTQPPPTRPQGSIYDFLVPMGLMLAVVYYIMWRGSRKDRQKQQDMLNAIKRNDRVQTIGGVLGTVVDARDDEVIVKVDETNNVKIRFSRSAIKEVISADAS